jgi:hypothetical protein
MSTFKKWASRVGYTVLILIGILPWPIIALGRAERSASAPAVLDDVREYADGRFIVRAYSFTVDGHEHHGLDVRGTRPRRGDRTWTADELEGMHVCYDPDRPGEEHALAPARYRCGDAEIFTTDGGW